MKFPKSARVLKRREYLQFFHQSDVKKLHNCVIFRIPNAFGNPRLGITVKARTNSVLRNKIKRQIREHFRLNQQNFKPADYNIVVPGYVKVDHRTGKMVRSSLSTILKPWNSYSGFIKRFYLHLFMVFQGYSVVILIQAVSLNPRALVIVSKQSKSMEKRISNARL